MSRCFSFLIGGWSNVYATAVQEQLSLISFGFMVQWFFFETGKHSRSVFRKAVFFVPSNANVLFQQLVHHKDVRVLVDAVTPGTRCSPRAPLTISLLVLAADSM